MAGTPDVQQWAVMPAADRRLPVAVLGVRWGVRMARFAADSRLARLLVLGGLVAAGWLLSMIFGVFGSAAAHAETLSSSSFVAAGSALADGFPTASDTPTAEGLPTADPPADPTVDPSAFPTVDPTVELAVDPMAQPMAQAMAQAMAGRNVDGLTSQSKPVLPAPSTADHSSGSNGLAPQGGGGSILFGEVARSLFDPRLLVVPAPRAAAAPPVVRTAADDPSFSPD